MTNSIQIGDCLDVVLAANVSSGDVVAVGGIQGVAKTSGLSGETIAVAVKGVFELTKNTATDVIAAGDALFVDGSGEIDPSGAGNSFIGYAVEASGNGVATVKVLLVNNSVGQAAAYVAQQATTASAGYVQAEAQATIDKVNEILTALKGAGLMLNA